MIRCSVRLRDPEDAGATSWQELQRLAKEFPYLRPCHRAGWGWRPRQDCEQCADAVKEMPPGGETPGGDTNEGPNPQTR